MQAGRTPLIRYPPRRGAVAVVTGGAGGIGAALARRLAADGARVAVTDIDVEGAGAVASSIDGAAFALDVSDAGAVQKVIDEVEQSLGPVEIYVSNAGLLVPGGLDTPADAWQRSWDVHVMAHVHAAQVLVPRWLARGGGMLVVTASAAGLLTQLDSASYAVSKHAAVAAAEWLAITYGDRIQFACLCPQAVRTPLLTGEAAERGEAGAAAEAPPGPASTMGSASGSTAAMDEASAAPVAESPAGSLRGSAAALDGVLEPEQVADATAEALAAGRFLVLPHPEVAGYARRRAGDPDRWLAGMRRLARRLAADSADSEDAEPDDQGEPGSLPTDSAAFS